MTLPPTSPNNRALGDGLDVQTLKDSRDREGGPVLAMHEYLFVALEADRPLAGGARYSLAGIDQVVLGRGTERGVTRTTDDGVHRLMLRLPGKSLSGLHARLVRGVRGWTLEDAGSTNGTFINGKRVTNAVVGLDDVVEVGHSFLLLRTFPLPVDEAPGDHDIGASAPEPTGFATLLPPLAAQLHELARIARSDVTVVLCGETGTGKELLARGIHQHSERRGPFVGVNCGALTESLAESQLFGHVRGAFTDAVADATGFVRSAEQGTLLLDEVGDLCRSGQVAMLRVLQEREVVPVGSARNHKVNVRFIASSPAPLTRQVEGGAFRSDLFARLSGYTMITTPLRQRREDIGVLIAALLRRLGVGPSDSAAMAPDAALRLLQHGWPLNIRELEQTLRRAWALADGGVIGVDHLAMDRHLSGGTPSGQPLEPAVVLSAAEHELRLRLVEELKAASGNVAEVARKMGKARMQLHRWMTRFQIDPDTFRT